MLFLFGAAAQFGIFAAILIACLLGFDLKDAASIGIIGAADGPTSILVSQVLGSNYMGPIAVAAYSYMALVPIIQPFAIRLVTTHKERCIHMEYNPKSVNKTLRIAFPIAVTIIVGFISPQSVALVGFLMFGNLLRECGVLNSLSQAAQNELANIITLLLGITISFSMKAEQFVNPATLMIMALGLVAFVFDTIGGVLFAKLVNVFLKMAGKKACKPNDRRLRHFRVPHVFPCRSKTGGRRGAGKYHSHAGSRNQCIRTGGLCDCRRPGDQYCDTVSVRRKVYE